MKASESCQFLWLSVKNLTSSLKARTHMLIFGEYASESVDSELESANSNTDSSADSSRICVWVWV